MALQGSKHNSSVLIGDPQWFHNLSPAAQDVYRREKNKELPRIYSGQWFSEYWYGKRTLLYALFGLGFALLVPLKLIAGILLYISINVTAGSSASPILEHTIFTTLQVSLTLLIICYIFQTVCLWRCANNSRPFFKYFGKCVTLLFVLDVLGVIKTWIY